MQNNIDRSNTSFKTIRVFDVNKIDDHANISKTEVTIMIPGTDIVLFKGSNKVILPGAGFTARAHFDLPRAEITPSYNSALGLENSVNETPSTSEKVYLFCAGTSGCGRENSDVRVVNYGKWITPDSLVPFRYPLEAEDLTGVERDQYFGRVVKDGRVAYYFKTFDTVPVFVQKYADGTLVDSNVYESEKTDEIESYVELNLSINENDCREWFKETTGINDARVNAISLCTAWAKAIDGQIYYQDIRPLTVYFFQNEPLASIQKSIAIKYCLFY